ncbi:DNA-formamidopyrimidine glycosylase family protein [uncultured Jatrophihabitans sp.]|uniref:DNA-formamidopyrimidine glycosylase family protein n=1 Tax=uncultured Jatrophihabitans sp. TaxID=1610747 RepID=UPI0035C9ED4D
MPELPEVESARAVIERSALGRRIADVDDRDTYECRPHQPGELREALVGRTLASANRRGKLMWCETSGLGRSRTPGPSLALHLGMAGRILATQGATTDEGGDYAGPRGRPQQGSATRKPEWDRFTITFTDGGTLRLFDKRRLGRVYLNPDVDALGPDAGEITATDFRARVGRGTLPIKARLLDQATLAGVGNLLADEVLWQAEISPRTEAGRLTTDDLARLRRDLRKAIRHAIRLGGVHHGEIIPYRARGEHCPRCGAEMVRGTVGGRTTWWCSKEQA